MRCLEVSAYLKCSDFFYGFLCLCHGFYAHENVTVN
jgi:hypothetical protein